MNGSTTVSRKPDSLRESLNFLRYVRPYRACLYAGLLTLLVCSLMRLVFPFLAGTIIDASTVPGGATVPLFGELSFTQLALLLATAVALHALGSFTTTLAFNRVGQNALADLRCEVYGRLITFPMAVLDRRRVGELTSRVSLDIAQIEGALIGALPQICLQSVFILGALTLFAATSDRLTWVILFFLPGALAVAAFFGRCLRRGSREVQDRLAVSNTVVEETLHAIISVKAFTNEKLERERFRRSQEGVLAATLAAARWRAAFGAFFIASLFGCMVLVLCFGAELLHRGEVTAGELTRLLLYLIFVGGAVGQATDLFSQIQRAAGAIQRVGELLGEPTEPRLETGSAPLRVSLPERLQGEVEFEAVEFHYPSRPSAAVLRGVNLKVKRGERIALVGPSGGGKSTLTQLLLRLYSPDSGRLLIDGRDARDYPLHWLRAQMSIVPQEVVLFGGTILENIAYGKPGAGHAEIMEAAARAYADDFIRELPEAYQTLVGDRGTKLSGGQRQRIAIARAILRNPAILILDEATSSLDAESERLIHAALEHLMRGRTCLVIAHRLSTVRNADTIAVVERGRIVEHGTHEQLFAIQDGVYHRLSLHQFGASADSP